MDEFHELWRVISKTILYGTIAELGYGKNFALLVPKMLTEEYKRNKAQPFLERFE